MTEADYCPETGDQPRDSLTRRDLATLREIIERIQGGPLRKHVVEAAMELLERQEAELAAEREHWGDYLLGLADQYLGYADLARDLRAAGRLVRRHVYGEVAA